MSPAAKPVIGPALTAEQAYLPVGPSQRKIRVARWDLPTDRAPRAAVILLPGLSEFIDKYEETARDLLARDLLVFAIDWGGQGRSDRPLANRQKIHTVDFSHRLDDIDALMAWAAPMIGELPVILLGHSMGGHIAMRCAGERPPARLAAVALCAPMVSIKMVSRWEPIARCLTGLLVRLGLGERYMPGSGDFSQQIMEQNLGYLTSDPRRQRYHLDHYLRDPNLQCGAITWGWMKAALASCARVRRSGFLQHIDCPAMLAVAGREMLVSNPAARLAAGRMADCQMLEVPQARHEILMETDEMRDAFLAAFDTLLERADIAG